MIGYATKTKGYRIWLLKNRKVIKTIHVKIDDSKNVVDTLFDTERKDQKITTASTI